MQSIEAITWIVWLKPIRMCAEIVPMKKTIPNIKKKHNRRRYFIMLRILILGMAGSFLIGDIRLAFAMKGTTGLLRQNFDTVIPLRTLMLKSSPRYFPVYTKGNPLSEIQLVRFSRRLRRKSFNNRGFRFKLRKRFSVKRKIIRPPKKLRRHSNFRPKPVRKRIPDVRPRRIRRKKFDPTHRRARASRKRRVPHVRKSTGSLR